jgi:hypothetical protein
MITEFTDPTEIKRLILDEQIKPARVRSFFKKQGIFLLMSKTTDLADSAYTFFLGSHDLSLLQESVHSENNYQKSTILVIEPVNEIQTQDELGELLMDGMNRYKAVNRDTSRLESVIRRGDGGSTAVFSYEKRIPGKNAFMSVVKKTIEVHIDKIPKSKNMIVDIRRSDPNDTREIINFLAAINTPAPTDQPLFCLNHISLESLDNSNKIEFFDKILKNKFKGLKLETITGITVRKVLSDDDDDELNMETDQNGTLAGISSAILRGNGLRTNEFVQSCLKSNFMITSMKFKYSSTSEAISVVIDVNFKNNDIRIDIDKSYEVGEDGKEYLAPISPSEQSEILKKFQDFSCELYRKLIEDQKGQTYELKDAVK